jgi:hypothetical protein
VAGSAAKVPVEAEEVMAPVLVVTDSLAFGVPVRESLLLQRFAVNLINANKAADKIPIFLI